MSTDARAWTPDQLKMLTGLRELEIAAPRDDGARGRWTPIWVVVAGGAVFVRTWRIRETGWYGRAARIGRAWVRLANDAVAVSVTATGMAAAEAVDAAYRAKYGAGGAGSMVSPEAVASTLRLAPV